MGLLDWIRKRLGNRAQAAPPESHTTGDDGFAEIARWKAESKPASSAPALPAPPPKAGKPAAPKPAASKPAASKRPRKPPKLPKVGKAQHAPPPAAPPPLVSEVLSLAEADRRYGALFAAPPSPPASTPQPAPKPLPAPTPPPPVVDPTDLPVAEPEPPKPEPEPSRPPPSDAAREGRAARAQAERARQDHERAWVDWAVLPRFQALLATVDAVLATEPVDGRQLLSARRTLLDDWNALGPLPREQAADLEAGLQARLDALSVRRREAEANLDQERDGNLTAKAALLGAAEAALEGDARAVTDALRVLMASWKTIGPVPRSEIDALGARYKAVVDGLHARRRALRAVQDAAAADRMEQLVRIVTQAEALPSARDPSAAAERARVLQASWKAVGPTGPRGEVDALWQRFRGACDAVFARRNEVEDARRQANIARKEALIARAVGLAEAGEVADPDAVIRALQADWRKVGQVPRAEADALWSRFRAACDAIRNPPPIDQAALGDGANTLQFQPFAALAPPKES